MKYGKHERSFANFRTSDLLALPTRPTLPPFSARPAGSNSSAGLKQQQDRDALKHVSDGLKNNGRFALEAAEILDRKRLNAAVCLRNDGFPEHVIKGVLAKQAARS